MSNIKKRINTIRALEDLLLKEAVEEYQRSKKFPISANERAVIESNWHKHSSFFTRMWLNYMDDSKLELLLIKKMQERKDGDTAMKFISSY